MEKEQREREEKQRSAKSCREKEGKTAVFSSRERCWNGRAEFYDERYIYTPLDLRNTPLGLLGDKSESARVQWGRGEKRGIREGVREKKRGGRGERGTALSAPICGRVPALVPNAPARDRNYG